MGEAVVIGPAIRVPALVKIDKFEGLLGGTDPDVKKEWKMALKEEERKEEEKALLAQEIIVRERHQKL